MSFDIRSELAACTVEELVALSRHFEEMEDRFDPDWYDPDDPTVPPRHFGIQLLRADLHHAIRARPTSNPDARRQDTGPSQPVRHAR